MIIQSLPETQNGLTNLLSNLKLKQRKAIVNLNQQQQRQHGKHHHHHHQQQQH